jgi:hypothetical protein
VYICIVIIEKQKNKDMIALRFTRTKNEAGFTSEDQVNKVQFPGLCAYDITDAVNDLIEDGYSESDAYEICAKKQAEFDNWHAHNSKGSYVIFAAKFVEYERDNQDRFGGRAVIVKLEKYLAYGELKQLNYGYACKSIELV